MTVLRIYSCVQKLDSLLARDSVLFIKYLHEYLALKLFLYEKFISSSSSGTFFSHAGKINEVECLED
jgi:hypothetical protein